MKCIRSLPKSSSALVKVFSLSGIREREHLKAVEGNSPSLEGVTALLDAGLAGVGEAAGTGMATDSVGIVPG